MRFVTSKRGLPASLYHYGLGLVITLAAGITISFAEERTIPYQSAFDDYKTTITEDSLKDWKSSGLLTRHPHKMEEMGNEAMGQAAAESAPVPQSPAGHARMHHGEAQPQSQSMEDHHTGHEHVEGGSHAH